MGIFLRIIRKKCLELNVMKIVKPCCEIYKKTAMITIIYQLVEENIRDASFPQIISLAEIYSFIDYIVWLGPGLGSVKTAETIGHASKMRKYLFCEE